MAWTGASGRGAMKSEVVLRNSILDWEGGYRKTELC